MNTGVSGAKSNRPARNRLAEAARRQFDLGLVLRLDRWAARWPTACVLRAEESSLMGRFMISIMSAFSELEREMIVERVVAGVKKAQAAGKHCGRPGASSGGTGSWS